MQKIINLIEANHHLHEMLKNCPYRILEKMSIYNFQEGEVLIYQGDIIKRFYMIVEGSANIYVMSENGRRYSQAIYKKGDFIGEIEIFDGLPSVSNVEALSKLVLIGIDSLYFLEWLKIDNHMSNYFNRSLSKYLYNLATKSKIDSLYPLKYRLCDYLLNQIVPNHTKQNVIRMNKNDISEQLAVTVRSVNRIFKDLEDKGIIQFDKNQINILSVHLLEQEKNYSILE